MVIFCVLYFQRAACMQHISDKHSKFAIRPHHVWKYGIDIQRPTADRRGKKKKKKIIQSSLSSLAWSSSNLNSMSYSIFTMQVFYL